jgi:hypothetical protein
MDVPMAVITGYLFYSVSKISWVPQLEISQVTRLTDKSLTDNPPPNNSSNSYARKKTPFLISHEISEFQFCVFEFCLIAAFLILMKPTGLFFAFICILALTIKGSLQLIQLKKNYSAKLSLRSLFKICLVGWSVLLISVTSLVTYLSWFIRLNIMGTGDQGKLHLRRLWDFISGNPADYQIESANNYWERIINGDLIYIGFGLKVPLFISLVLLMLIFATLLFNYLNWVNYLTLLISLLIGNIFYVILMLLLYQSQFPEIEAIGLFSFDRYMRTFLLITFVTIAFFILKLLIKSKSEDTYSKNPKKIRFLPAAQFIVFGIFLSLSVQPEGYQSLIPPTENTSLSIRYQPKAELIISNTELGSNISIISELDRAPLYLGYYIFQHNNLYWRTGVASAWDKPLQRVIFNEKDISWDHALTTEDQVSPEQFHSSYLEANVEYLYLDNYDEYFAKTYGDMFPNFGEGRLYHVTKNGFDQVA